IGIVNVFRPSEETIEIAKQSIKIGANVFWCQLGIHNESAAKLISENKIYYISNKCIKVEYERLFRKI
ncbi:CoA-binding protein, partial [Candidatus Pelagibacter sp.]|nr:CoA-binding protein [Candidatus Pelagibacter sp.]